MRPVATLCAAALLGYTAALIGLEWSAGGAAVRPYLEDPALVPRFAAVNTAFSTGLLWAAAVLFLGALRVGTALGNPGLREKAFLVFQFLFFLGLGLDERFRLVPGVAQNLGVSEVLLYVGVGSAEIIALVWLGRVPSGPRLQTSFVLGGIVAFAAALAGDLLLAPDFPLRRTAEDLPKVWGGACLVLFAWRRMMDRVDAAAPLWEMGAAFRLGRETAPSEAGPWQAAGPPTPRLSELADSTAPRVGKEKGVPVPRTNTPEPISNRKDIEPSAAPPRKLLSH